MVGQADKAIRAFIGAITKYAPGLWKSAGSISRKTIGYGITLGGKTREAHAHFREHGPRYRQKAGQVWQSTQQGVKRAYGFTRAAVQFVAPIFIRGKTLLANFYEPMRPALVLCKQEVFVFGRGSLNAVMFSVKTLMAARDSGALRPIPVRKVDEDHYEFRDTTIKLKRIDEFFDEESDFQTSAFKSDEEPPGIYAVLQLEGLTELEAYKYNELRTSVDMLEVRELATGESALVKVQKKTPKIEPAAAPIAPPSPGKIDQEIVVEKEKKKKRSQRSSKSVEKKTKIEAPKAPRSKDRDRNRNRDRDRNKDRDKGKKETKKVKKPALTKNVKSKVPTGHSVKKRSKK